jgi:hypothetical protein
MQKSILSSLVLLILSACSGRVEYDNFVYLAQCVCPPHKKCAIDTLTKCPAGNYCAVDQATYSFTCNPCSSAPNGHCDDENDAG